MIRRLNTTQSSQISEVGFSREAKLAISHGVQRGDAVAEFELLGLPVRTINLLEDSALHITRLEELMSYKPEELLEIPNFGMHGLREMMQCLAKYHQLDEAKKQVSLAFDRRKDHAMQELFASGEPN